MAQRAGELLAGRPSRGSIETSYWFETVPGDVSAYLPAEFVTSLKSALKTFDAKLRGFVGEGVLIGFEGRASCPVRVVRGEDRMSVSTPGLYPAGEGAGYAGGIVSSAVDGLHAARAMVGRYWVDA